MWRRAMQMCSWCSYRETSHVCSQSNLAWSSLDNLYFYVNTTFAFVAKFLPFRVCFICAYCVWHHVPLPSASPSHPARPPTSHWSWSRWSTLRQASTTKSSRRWREPKCLKLCSQRWPPTRARWVSHWENRSKKILRPMVPKKYIERITWIL